MANMKPCVVNFFFYKMILFHLTKILKFWESCFYSLQVVAAAKEVALSSFFLQFWSLGVDLLQDLVDVEL